MIELTTQRKRGLRAEFRRRWWFYSFAFAWCGWFVVSPACRYIGFVSRAEGLADDLEDTFGKQQVGELTTLNGVINNSSEKTFGDFILHVVETRESESKQWHGVEYFRNAFSFESDGTTYQLENDKYSFVINGKAWPLTPLLRPSRIICDWDHVESRSGKTPGSPPTQFDRVRGIKTGLPVVISGELLSPNRIDPYLVQAGTASDLIGNLRASRHSLTCSFFFWSTIMGAAVFSLVVLMLVWNSRRNLKTDDT